MTETITQGKWFRFGYVGQPGLCRIGVAGEPDRTGRCQTIQIGSFENPADTELAVEANEVLHETGMGPREMADRLQFLKSRGLTVGLATEVGKERYLTYMIETGSELCDLATVNKLVDAEHERDKLAANNAELISACQLLLRCSLPSDVSGEQMIQTAREILRRAITSRDERDITPARSKSE